MSLLNHPLSADHSIGQEVNGNCVHTETREERLILKHTCVSIESGIYQPELGVRSKVDVFIDGEGTAHVTGGERQTEVVAVLGRY